MGEEEGSNTTCACLTTPSVQTLVIFQELGYDSQYGEASLLVCAACGQFWLRYLYENEGFSRSGRWYMGPVAFGQINGITGENAKETLEGLEWYFFGGSYFGGKTGRSSGFIHL
jgi:hypothetical protein